MDVYEKKNLEYLKIRKISVSLHIAQLRQDKRIHRQLSDRDNDARDQMVRNARLPFAVVKCKFAAEP